MKEGINWYVLRAIAGQERKIKSWLESEVIKEKLEEFVPQILIPSEKVYQIRNGKKVVRERSFFPGYILVSADLSHGEVKHLITSMPGVLGFLSSDNSATKIPVPLRQSEVNRILGKIDETSEQVVAPEYTFIKGEIIKIIEGPFSGFEGSIEEIFDDRKRVNVSVKIFKRITAIELHYSQIERMV